LWDKNVKTTLQEVRNGQGDVKEEGERPAREARARGSDEVPKGREVATGTEGALKGLE